MRAHEKKMVSTTARSRRMQQMVVQSAGGLKMILVSSAAVVLLLLLLTGSCCAQSEVQANAYLDEVEKEVMQIAAQASVNFLNTCGWLQIWWHHVVVLPIAQGKLVCHCKMMKLLTLASKSSTIPTVIIFKAPLAV
jgi:hypothetical protein